MARDGWADLFRQFEREQSERMEHAAFCAVANVFGMERARKLHTPGLPVPRFFLESLRSRVKITIIHAPHSSWVEVSDHGVVTYRSAPFQNIEPQPPHSFPRKF